MKERDTYETIQLAEHIASPSLIYAEQRLWAAVALMLIDDYRTILLRISAAAKRGPVNLTHLRTLEAIRREAKHEWYGTICGNINVDASHVISKLDKMDLEFGLSKITFTKQTSAEHRVQTPGARQRLREKLNERKNLPTG